MNEMTVDELLAATRELIRTTEYCFFITAGKDGHPHARLMQPFPPENDFTIYFGASPRSRKVRQLLGQPRVSLAFYNQQSTAYVTLSGTGSVTEQGALRQKYWRSNWNDLFPGGPESGEYTLIKFVPEKIEMMNFAGHAMPQPYSLHPTILVRHGSSWKLSTNVTED
ncbi:MAG TPA: pyridoxamine 5'-phosphate oxidase family protein [Bacteroidota bacterium]